METAGLVPQMVQGRRYTDERTLAIAEHVLCNQINRFIDSGDITEKQIDFLLRNVESPKLLVGRLKPSDSRDPSLNEQIKPLELGEHLLR